MGIQLENFFVAGVDVPDQRQGLISLCCGLYTAVSPVKKGEAQFILRAFDNGTQSGLPQIQLLRGGGNGANIPVFGVDFVQENAATLL